VKELCGTYEFELGKILQKSLWTDLLSIIQNSYKVIKYGIEKSDRGVKPVS